VVQTLVHAGQHYDVNISHIFFQQLGIPIPVVRGGLNASFIFCGCRNHSSQRCSLSDIMNQRKNAETGTTSR
jgi:hypothetical protein